MQLRFCSAKPGTNVSSMYLQIVYLLHPASRFGIRTIERQGLDTGGRTPPSRALGPPRPHSKRPRPPPLWPYSIRNAQKSSFGEPRWHRPLQSDTNSSASSGGFGHPTKIVSRIGARGLPSSISALRKAWRSLHFKLDSWAYCSCDKVADEFQAGTGRERKPGAPEKLGWGHPVCQGLCYASRAAAH